MREQQIDSSNRLFEVLHTLKDSRAWIFRGQQDATWHLLPKAGRQAFASKYKRGVTERTIYESWKRYALHFMTQKPQDEWDWLVLAQHHGLATRLLDWTKNPLNAAFFAVNQNRGNNAAIYAFEVGRTQTQTDGDPFEVEGLKVYFPRGLSARIISQRGIFTISENPAAPVENALGNRLHKFVITPSAAKDIRQTLEFFGINEMSIFQDLDHLSEHLNELVLSDGWSR